YRTMIEEMLDRHKFKTDPGGSVLTYTVADKHRFLREFALESAVGGGFSDFDRAELTVFAEDLAPNLDAVQDPREFVAEIVERSGLLTDASETGQFVFAHRSIHEQPRRRRAAAAVGRPGHAAGPGSGPGMASGHALLRRRPGPAGGERLPL